MRRNQCGQHFEMQRIAFSKWALLKNRRVLEHPPI